jgi:peptide/nickel transport system substrate-binding protein
VAPWIRLEQFRTTSSRNRGKFSDPELDAAINDLRVAATPEERESVLKEIQEVWNESVPVVNTSATEDVVIWKDDVHGLQFSLESIVLLDKVFVDG